MLCILKYEHSRITGWIIATDPHDARRQADNIGERSLAAALYRLEFTPRLGAYFMLGEQSYFRECEGREVEAPEFGYLMLVS